MGNCIQKIIQLLKPGKVINISGKKLRQLHQIAQGGYAYVILVEDTQTRKKYALKKLICQTEQQKQNFLNQVQIMKKLSECKHIVQFYGSHSIIRNQFLEGYILMQLAKRTVYDLLLESQKTNIPLSQKQILRIFKETVQGVKEMHDLGLIHQDLKVQNILLSQDNEAKLCDFGSCSTEKINLEDVPKAKIYHYQQRFQKNTTLMYRPPEMIDLYLKYPIDERVDIWTLGCILFVMNYRYHPFQEEGKLSIVNTNVKYKKNGTSEKMIDFMRHMLTPNPNFRPRIEEVLHIVQNWQKIQHIALNRVAAKIKQDDEHRNRGEFQQITLGSWRNLNQKDIV